MGMVGRRKGEGEVEGGRGGGLLGKGVEELY